MMLPRAWSKPAGERGRLAKVTPQRDDGQVRVSLSQLPEDRQGSHRREPSSTAMIS